MQGIMMNVNKLCLILLVIFGCSKKEDCKKILMMPQDMVQSCEFKMVRCGIDAQKKPKETGDCLAYVNALELKQECNWAYPKFPEEVINPKSFGYADALAEIFVANSGSKCEEDLMLPQKMTQSCEYSMTMCTYMAQKEPEKFTVKFCLSFLKNQELKQECKWNYLKSPTDPPLINPKSMGYSRVITEIVIANEGKQ